MNGVFKISNKDTQKFRVEVTDKDDKVTLKEWDLSGLVLSNTETFEVTLTDGLTSEIIDVIDAYKGEDLTDFLNNLVLPEHQGYEFSGFDNVTQGFDYTDVQMDGVVVAGYTLVGDKATSFINGDGDITVVPVPSETLSGSGSVEITFAKAIATVSYDAVAVVEFGEGSGIKEDATIDGSKITFTDSDLSTMDFFAVQFTDSGATQIPGADFIDEGVIPSHIKITQSSDVVFECDIRYVGE